MRTLRLRVTAVEDIGYRIERRQWFGWTLVETCDTHEETVARTARMVRDWRLIHPLQKTIVSDISRAGR